jgi:enoyl-CoA hydratase
MSNTELNAYQNLLLARDGRLLTITLNRPPLNAFNTVMHTELIDALEFAAADPDSDVVLITGAGRAFSAGGDLDQMLRIAKQPELFDEEAVNAKRLVFALLDVEKPIVAKVNGHAVGLGATIALLCDVIFAADTAKIGDPHVAVGLVAGDGGAVIWPQLIGFARAKEFLLTGELLAATRAEAIGLINHALPASELDEAVNAFCQRLCDGATSAIRWTKVTVNVEMKRIAHAIMDTGIDLESRSVRTADHLEAVNAFREKRTPKFGNTGLGERARN